ncbi:MAG: prenyltransferase/squalene oxidase repeat-containing protein [Candidatus Merdivicinus sp.]
MKHFYLALVAAMCSLFILWSIPFPVLAASSDTEESSTVSQETISVSVQFLEKTYETSIIPSLQLNCPQGTTVADLLELLKSYAYLTGYTTDQEQLHSISKEMKGEILSYTAEDNWQLDINGTVISSPLSVTLQNGDVLKWSFTSQRIDTMAEDEMDLPVDNTYTSPTSWTDEQEESLSSASTWLKIYQENPFSLFCLGAAGVSVEYKNIARLIHNIPDTSYATAADLATTILAVTFCGIPATNVSNQNLIHQLADYPDISRGGSRSAMLSLLALDSNDYSLPDDAINTRSTLCSVILSSQNSDGGFSSQLESDSTAFHTALALTALSPYRKTPEVNSAITQGLDYLSNHQNEDGSFPGTEEFSTQLTTCLVICGFYSLGISADDPTFARSNTPLEALLSFQTHNGGFCPEYGTAADEDSTAAAVLALAAAKFNRDIFVLRTLLDASQAALPEAQSESSVESSAIQAAEQQNNSLTQAWYVPLAAVLLALLACTTVILLFRRRMQKNLPGGTQRHK